jgi:hypothetical protein
VETLNNNLLIDLPQIKSLRFINSPNEGIAKSRRSTGEVVINSYWWRRLPKEHRIFVLLHEAGHIEHDTVDELLADKYASDLYLKMGYEPEESVKALTQHLNRNNPVHIARAWAQYKRALEYDYRKNGNLKAYRQDYDDMDEVKQKLKVMVNTYEPEYTNFLGVAIGKKARARKQQKFDVRMDAKNARTHNLISKADSRRILAEQGITQPSGGSAVGQAITGVASLAGTVTGIGKVGDVLKAVSSADAEPLQTFPDAVNQVPTAIFPQGNNRTMGSMAPEPVNTAQQKNKNMPFIIAGIGIIVIVIAAVVFKK